MTLNPLYCSKEREQIAFVSDETRHGIDYIKHDIEDRKYSEAETFFEEDGKVQTDLEIPVCRLNRH